MKNYFSVSPEDKNGQMTVLKWDFKESSFQDADCAESTRLPLIILPFPTTWSIDVMARNAASLLSP